MTANQRTSALLGTARSALLDIVRHSPVFRSYSSMEDLDVEVCAGVVTFLDGVPKTYAKEQDVAGVSFYDLVTLAADATRNCSQKLDAVRAELVRIVCQAGERTYRFGPYAELHVAPDGSISAPASSHSRAYAQAPTQWAHINFSELALFAEDAAEFLALPQALRARHAAAALLRGREDSLAWQEVIYSHLPSSATVSKMSGLRREDSDDRFIVTFTVGTGPGRREGRALLEFEPGAVSVRKAEVTLNKAPRLAACCQ